MFEELKKSKEIINIIKRMIRDGDVSELKLEELINELSSIYERIIRAKKDNTTFDEILPGVRDEGFHARQKSEPGYYIYYDPYTKKIMEKDLRNSIIREYNFTNNAIMANDWELLNKTPKVYFVLLEDTGTQRKKLSETPVRNIESAIEKYKDSHFKVLKLIEIPELNNKDEE